MTEPNLGVSSLTAETPTDKPKRKPSRAIRVTVASLLSLLLPGFGQIYVRRISRGIVFALSIVVIEVISSQRHFMLNFPTMVGFFTLAVVWRLAITADAFRLAWKYDPTVAGPRDWKKAIVAFLLAFLLVGYPVPDYLQRRALKFFGANRIASRSMCPTICLGERVVVNKEAFKTGAPTRGDIIIFQFKDETAPFLKRVIGIEGDTVSQGPGNSILVNGKPIPEPQVCGRSHADSQSQSGSVEFSSTKVPAGTLFVIGDNLVNSFDSRFPEFGVVNIDHVRGKPLFVYWSSDRSRIGCTLR
jgi:signal peptidase I